MDLAIALLLAAHRPRGRPAPTLAPRAGRDRTPRAGARCGRGRAVVGAVAALLATSVAGCGETQRGGAAGARASARPAVAEGQRIFATACIACHTLTGNRARATQGGDLAGYRMSMSQVASFTRIMPLRRPLTDVQLRAVSAYVVAAQHRYAQGR